MSLIIHTIVPEGIVVCADTRTTHRDGKGHVQYDDTAEKIVPFPNRIVVSHCGDAKVRENLTVMQFLYDIRKKYGKQTTIDDLPLKILNEYFRVNGNGCTIFKISGYFEFGRTACTYQTKAGKAHDFNRGMKGRTLELLWEKFQNNSFFVYIHVFVTTWHLKYDIIDT